MREAPRPQPNSVFAQFSVVCMFNWMLGQLRRVIERSYIRGRAPNLNRLSSERKSIKPHPRPNSVFAQFSVVCINNTINNTMSNTINNTVSNIAGNITIISLRKSLSNCLTNFINNSIIWAILWAILKTILAITRELFMEFVSLLLTL